MSHCAHHHDSSNYINFINWLGLDPHGSGLIITLLLTGIAASFTHCIGMCGPIAITQMSMRLMHTPKDKMRQSSKLYSALALPYYLGKAFTYVIMMLIAMFLSQSIKNLPYIKWLAFILLTITAFLFIHAAISKTFQLIKLQSKFKYKFDNIFANKISKLSISPFGIQGLMMGMILGLIPCGIVYASIITVISSTNSYLIAIIAMMMFGLATIPALFLVSYLGERILVKFKGVFNYLYAFMMLINAYILLSHAFKLI